MSKRIECVEVDFVDIERPTTYRDVTDVRMFGDAVRIEYVYEGVQVADLFPLRRIYCVHQYSEESA